MADTGIWEIGKATETVAGKIEIATDAEAAAGTATNKALVPSNISSMSVTPTAHKDSHDPQDGSDPLDTASPAELAEVQAAGEGSSHSFARADHVHQIQHGITDNHLVTIDCGDVGDDDYARFTADGIEGRSVSETKTDMGYMTDLVDDTTPQLYDDLDGQGNHLVVVQNIPDLMSKGPGYWLNGVDKKFTIPQNNAYEMGTNDFAIVVEFETEHDAIQVIINNRDTHGVSLWVDATGYINITISDGTGATYVGTTAVNDGQRHCVILSGDRSGNATVYLDGKLINTHDISARSGSLVSTSDLFIGVYSPGGTTYFFDGALSRALLFNKALTTTEIRNFSSGFPVPYNYTKATQIHAADYDGTSGHADWGTARCTVASNVAVGGSNALTFTSNAVTGSHYANIDNNDYTKSISDSQILIKFSYYIPSGQSNVDGFKIRDNSGVVPGGLIISATLDAWTSVELDIFASDSTGSLMLRLTDGGAETFSDAGADDYLAIKDLTITIIGCVLQLEQPGIGHSQWLDSSDNELHAEAANGAPFNLPANHIEKYRHTVAITDDTTFTSVVPAGYELNKIIFVESAGNAATLDLGTTSGASDVFVNQVITASSITTIVINKTFSMSAAQSLFLNDDDAGSSWNSGSLTATLLMQKVI